MRYEATYDPPSGIVRITEEDPETTEPPNLINVEDDVKGLYSAVQVIRDCGFEMTDVWQRSSGIGFLYVTLKAVDKTDE